MACVGRCTGVIKCRATRGAAGGGVRVKFWVLIEYKTDQWVMINNWTSGASIGPQASGWRITAGVLRGRAVQPPNHLMMYTVGVLRARKVLQ